MPFLLGRRARGGPSAARAAAVGAAAAALLAATALSVGPAALAADDPELPDFMRPAESFAPVDLELDGTLPRSGDFAGARFTVEEARVTNTHPYTMFGDPRPGELFYVVLTVVGENPTASDIDYGFDDEAFALRTWSGQLLPGVHSPGRLAFSRLDAGARAEDELAFGSLVPDVLDGSALLVGQPPDVPTVIPLTAPPLSADYPRPVTWAAAAPVQAGAVAWELSGGEASLDRPVGLCCPKSGLRADEGELYLTLRLLGRVDGSKYGQATVSTDAIRLVVAGEPTKPLRSAGKANVPEGDSYEMTSSWVVPEDDPGLALELRDASGAVVATVPLLVGPRP